MAKRINCLKRLGDHVKKYKIILLDGKDEVTIGRTADVTVCFYSTMISRYHAVLKKTETGSWTIKDNKSVNGVFVNDKRLEPLKPYTLQEGDKVQLGVRTSPEAPPEFLFQYFTALKVKYLRNGEDAVDGIKSGKKPRLEENKIQEDAPCGSSRDGITTDGTASPSRLKRPCGDQDSPFEKYRRKKEQQDLEASKKLAEMEVKLKEMQRLLQEKDSAKEEMEQELKVEKDRREKQLKMMEGLKEKERQLKEELEKKQEELAREKEDLQEKMKEELEVKEATLLENLELQKQALLKEKQQVEEKLKQELESEREKDKKLSEELVLQKQKLQKVIENKEAEQRLLESELKDTRKEKDRKEEEVLQAREDVLSRFAELMETELQCSICNELFVKAMSLNCSHSFCSLCIAHWMKVKKECPQCRAAITTHMRSIVLDSYIEKMVEQFSEEKKTQRKELVEERKKEEAAFEEANKPQPSAVPARGRGRGGRGRGRTRGGLMSAPPPPEPAPIMISEDEDNSDYESESELRSLSDSDSDDYVDGDDDAYFGGYGRCYNCGSRGHWANGCPFR